MTSAVVVGAGPAGIAAASVLADAGVMVTLVDEAAHPGGQIYRAPASGLDLDMRRLLGAHAGAYEAFHRKANVICGKVNYRPLTLAWNVGAGKAHLLSGSRLDMVDYDILVLATGATDRIMPVRGWTLPGVFTLGGAQALLKGQGCLIGRKTVFCGSSPLLYLAALQYLRMGGNVAAVIDTTPISAKIRALPRMASAPAILLEGLGYIRALRKAGVGIVHGATIGAFTGAGHVQVVEIVLPDGSQQRIECDSVAYGHGLRPESQLAEIGGSDMVYDPVRRFHMPDIGLDGRLSEGRYICGDAGRIGGGEAAALSGMLAGAAAVREKGLAVPSLPLSRLRHRLDRLLRFQRGLATAFEWPGTKAADLQDDVVLCRCERVTVGEVRANLAGRFGTGEVNRVKAATRCGMGRCQGRFCGHAVAEIVGAASGGKDEPLGRLRAQSPVKPLPISAAESAS